MGLCAACSQELSSHKTGSVANQRHSVSRAVAPSSGSLKQEPQQGTHQLKRLASPQRPSLSLKSQNPVQRYIIDPKNNDVVTDDGHYRMNAGNPTELLAHHGSGGPKPGGFFNITGTEKRQNSKGRDVDFQKYRSKSNLNVAGNWNYETEYQGVDGAYWRIWQLIYPAYDGPNDCGRYANGLLKKNSNWGFTRVYYRWDGANWQYQSEAFESYEALSVPAGAKRDKELKPSVGQALVITPPADSTKGPLGTSKHPDRCNFHAAPVVITTGSDYITNEANYCDPGRARPHWKISGSKKTGQSWHESYKDDYKDSRNKRRRAGLPEAAVWPTTHLREP